MITGSEFGSYDEFVQGHTTYHTGSAGPINYRLNVNYRTGRRGLVSPFSSYANDQPFNLPPVDVSEDTNHASDDSNCTHPAFEISTDAFIENLDAQPGPKQDSAVLTGDEMAHKVRALHLTKICRTRMNIRSSLLRKAVGIILRYFPGNYWISDPSVAAIIFEPYSVLLHHYHEIEEFISRESIKTTGSNMDDTATETDREITLHNMILLLDFLKPLYENTVKPATVLLAQDVPMIGFDMLWYLFRPGTDVWVQSTSNVYMAVVHETEYDQDERQQKRSSAEFSELILHLWCLSTDGNRVARTCVTHVIKRFAGQLEVTSLAVCPVCYWDATDQGARRQITLARNRLLVEAVREGSLHINYDDPNNIKGVVS